MKLNKYHVYCPRSTAALYLAWEFGLKAANGLLKTLPRDSRGWLDIAATAPWRGDCLTKRFADGLVTRIKIAVSFQEGRLGRDLSSGTVHVLAA